VYLPEPAKVQKTEQPSERVQLAHPVTRRAVPIALDTVLRLAEEQNHQVALAREKLAASETEKHLADLSWLPDIHAGVAYYRHEGGIQNEDGTLTHSSFGSLFPGADLTARLDLRDSMYKRINAERQVWQQEHELSRITSETLLEAASTYIDLLTARTTEAEFKRIEAKENEVVKRAEALFKSDASNEVLAEAARAQATGRKQAISQTHAQGDAAAAKLAYLLGLGPDVELIPVETALKPITLVDDKQPTDALVAQALQAGPGIRELEQMVAVIQDGIDRASGCGRFLPVFEVRALEGAFLAGPGDSLSSSNRLDMGFQMRWNLTDLFTAKDRTQLAQSRLQQAELGVEDLRGKLTMGVQESQLNIQASREEITLGNRQIQHADKSYQLSDKRLKENVPGGSTTEVLAALRVVEMAHLGTLSAIRAHNKAQVRLMVLTGAAGAGEHGKKTDCP
jgi:outer membrane protein TolC